MNKLLSFRYILALICAVFMLPSAAAATGSGEQADSLYSREEFRLAVPLYEQSLREEGPSADAYYNLGNAYYRTNQLGKAVVAYERALRLDPTHADARTNLEFVNSRITDLPEDDSSFIHQVQERIRNSMSANSWAWCAMGLFILLVACAALYIFSMNVGLRKLGFFGGIVIAVLFVYGLLTAFGAASRAQSHTDAVVIVPSTFISSTPRPSAANREKLVAIHEGTKVEILDSLATPDDPESPKWYNVKINNSTRAWLRAIDVEAI